MIKITPPSGRAWRDMVLCVLAGLLYGFAMPGMGAPPSLAFVALIPLLWATLEATPKRAMLLGWASGSIGFFVSMMWVADTVHTFGGLPYPLAYPTALLLAVYLGSYFGLFALLTGWLFRARTPLLLAAPFTWVALEYLRTHLFTGMPWNLLGLALYDYSRFIQMADTLGIYGISWFVVLINASLFVLLAPLLGRHPGRRQGFFFNHALVLVLMPVVVATYGQVRIASLSLDHQQHPNPDGPIRVALVQPNIAQHLKWRPSQLEKTFQQLERQTLSSADFAPDLIIWPEASAPLVLEQSPVSLRRLGTLARRLDTHLLIGSLAATADGSLLNSAYMINPSGKIDGQVSKSHLVPFGEYVPLASVLGFVRKLTSGIGNVIPGVEPTILSHPRGDVALAICYEIIFPNLVRKRAGQASYIATITNDAWFGSSAALDQHFAQAVFRAVENRSYVVRAANTGITGMIDPYGLIQQRGDINWPQVIEVNVDHRLQETYYTRHGDHFAWGSVILIGLFGVWAVLRPRRKSPQPALD